MSKLLDGLRGEREAVATGRLSFDRDEARAKMRMFRLPDPHFYVLQFVRAASVLGCGHIDFELTANRMVCTFGKPLNTDRFDDFWGAVFDARETVQERALHNIALGIGSAQALNPKEIRLQSGDVEIVFTDDGETVRTYTTGMVGTRIAMTEKLRFGQLLDFFTDHAEMIALREHCGYSEILVTVDGLSIRKTRGRYATDIDGRTESGFVALKTRQVFARGSEVHEVLAGPNGRTTFHFLRDDVLVRSHTVNAQLVPAQGAVTSSVLPTDLSGLELADDEMLDHLLFEKLYDAYHGSLLRWLDKTDATVDLVELGNVLFHHLETLRRRSLTTPRDTQRLVDWWRRQPVFHRALGLNAVTISAVEAERDEVIQHSSRRFSEKLGGHEHVVFADTAALQSLMNQMRVAGYRTEDVTIELARAADIWVRSRRWESQPKRAPSVHPVVRVVEAGKAVGELFAPLSPDGKLQRLDCCFVAYSAGKRLLRRPLRPPFGMLVDGALRIDDSYRDVVRDDRFRAVAEKLVAQVPYFIRDVLRLAALPQASKDTVTTALELLDGYLSGALFEVIADELRYPVDDLVPAALRIDHETNRLALLDKLGEIADIEVFRTVRGEARSMRQVYDAPNPPVVLFLRTMVTDGTAKMLHDLGHDAFVSTPSQQRILQQLRPDARDERFIEHAAHEVRFMDKPVFELPDVDPLAEASNHRELPAGQFNVHVQMLGEGSECETYLFYRERLLATRLFPSVCGRFRVAVQSHDLTPAFDFSDVEEDVFFGEIYEAITSLTRIVLSKWCMQVRVEDSMAPGHFRLLWDASVMWARDKPRALAIPVWRWRHRWEREVVSLEDLREIAEAEGGVLHAHRGQRSPPDHQAQHVILRCPANADLEDLLAARFVEVDTPANHEARDQFMRRPVVVPQMPYAAFEWQGEIDGVNLTIGMFSGPKVRVFGHENDIQVLWKGRRLEQVAQPVPFGQFRTVATSSSVLPDPNYEFVTNGRADVLRSAELGVALLLEALCRQLVERRDAPARKRGEVDWLIPDLLSIFAVCRRREPQPPFDLLDLLRETPLYETTFSGRVSFRELGELAIEGVIPYVTSPSAEHALLIDFALMPVIEETFGNDYALLPLSSVKKILGEHDEQPAPTRNSPPQKSWEAPPHEPARDPLLAELARALDAARGGWLPDGVIGGMQFDETTELARAELDGIRLQRRHELVEFCRQDLSDSIPIRFLASVVGSSINRHLRVVTDTQELELQAALIAADFEAS